MDNNESLFEKIKSKYIIKNICSYIKDENILRKLFLYSKSLQEKIFIKLFDYQEGYVNKRIKWEKYLYSNEYTDYMYFSKDKLKKQFKKDLEYLIPVDNDIIQKIVINYFSKKKYESDYSEHIDIYSPFFDILLETEFFGNIFIIQFLMEIIKKCKLKKDYISKFKELNKLNINYTSIDFYFDDDEDINFLKDCNINFNQLKKLVIRKQLFKKTYNEQLFKSLFTLIHTANNLVYLSLNIPNKDIKISNDSFEFINNFKFLEHLELDSFEFATTFIFKIKTLKNLKLILCKNITFEKDSLLQLKSLYLDYNTDINLFLNMPALEEISLNFVVYIEKMIDLKSIKNLKFFEGEPKQFLLLDCPLLEKVKLNKYINLEEQSKVIEKLCSLKLLKKIYLTIEINNEQISQIQCKNNSVTEMYIKNDNIKNDFNDCNYILLQNIFPNISDIFFDINYRKKEDKEIIYGIVENPDCKVKNIYMEIHFSPSFKFYCQSYEKLESVNFNIFSQEINLIKLFPIMSDKNNIIFKSLKSFKLSLFQYKMSLNDLNNIFNNIDNMPNLIDFSLNCTPDKIDIEFLKKFIRKILLMKFIKRINIKIAKDNYERYSKKELIKIFPDINFDNFYEINIKKFKIGVLDFCTFS